jgi:RNase H-like domain found in reverse transcriptase
MDPDKIKAIMQIKRPESKKEVRQILDLLGWFWQYSPNHAETAFLLTELTGKRVPYRIPWGDAEQNASDELQMLLQKVVDKPLKIIECNKPLLMHTDASDIAIAGSLSQELTDGSERPISCYSKQLINAQKAWPIIQHGAFAV